MQKFTENVIQLSSNTLKYQYSPPKESLEVDHNSSPNYLVRPKANGVFERTTSLTFFENKKVRYIWDNENKDFSKVKGLDSDIFCSYFYQQKGLNLDEQNKR